MGLRMRRLFLGPCVVGRITVPVGVCFPVRPWSRWLAYSRMLIIMGSQLRLICAWVYSRIEDGKEHLAKYQSLHAWLGKKKVILIAKYDSFTRFKVG